MQKEIKRISKKFGLSHIGSCISAYPVLKEIYEIKQPQDIVILDNAHAHLAHLFFITKDVEKMLFKYGIHCDTRAGCDVSGGSLGHGLGIGLGIALADRKLNVYVLVSDGSMMEGSNWEVLRIKEDLQVDNLKIYTNFNGYSAVAKIDLDKLEKRMKAFTHVEIRRTSNGEGFDGVQGHYKIL